MDATTGVERRVPSGDNRGRIVFCERVAVPDEVAEDLDTARMVTRIQAGEREEYATVYERYFDRIYGYLRVILRDPHGAEDGAQQVFMQAFEALPSYERRDRPFHAWLFTIARNAGLQRLKEQSRLEVLDENGEEIERHQASLDQSDQWALDWVSDPDLMLFIERLPLSQRQVLMLRFMADMSFKEIGEVLGRREDDVRALQYRALRFLRGRLAALGRSSRGRDRSRMRRCPERANVLRARRFALLS